MCKKLEKGKIPYNSSLADFNCFGPVALRDGEFENTMLTDLGCFTQDGKDSNKYYFGCVCKNKKNGMFYTYYEWGRTGKSSVSFQFYECDSKEEAQKLYIKQMHNKNDKRGEWVTIAGKRTLQAKYNKDCYLVRSLTTREHGLPNARNIAAEGNKLPQKTKTISKLKSIIDSKTQKLLKDINLATINFTRTNMIGKTLPSPSAIEEGRDILIEAQKRIAKIGNSIEEQLKDKEIIQLSNLLYSRIPKIKPIGGNAKAWMLNKDNIFMWQQDLDAFESGLQAIEIENKDQDTNILQDMQVDMLWIDPNTEIGKFIHTWIPKCTRNKHHGINNINIKNVWKITQNKYISQFHKSIENIANKKITHIEKPRHQPKDKRPDLKHGQKGKYMRANVGMLFHGTRSINISGIIKDNLKLPKHLVGVSITGALLGQGLYWADDWKKSAGYCSIKNSYWAGGKGKIANRGAFMFIADVALGKAHIPIRSKGFSSPPKGYDCIFGKSEYTDMGFGSKLRNNEWVTYNTKQHRIRYLIEFN